MSGDELLGVARALTADDTSMPGPQHPSSTVRRHPTIAVHPAHVRRHEHEQTGIVRSGCCSTTGVDVAAEPVRRIRALSACDAHARTAITDHRCDDDSHSRERSIETPRRSRLRRPTRLCVPNTPCRHNAPTPPSKQDVTHQRAASPQASNSAHRSSCTKPHRGESRAETTNPEYSAKSARLQPARGMTNHAPPSTTGTAPTDDFDQQRTPRPIHVLCTNRGTRKACIVSTRASVIRHLQYAADRRDTPQTGCPSELPPPTHP